MSVSNVNFSSCLQALSSVIFSDKHEGKTSPPPGPLNKILGELLNKQGIHKLLAEVKMLRGETWEIMDFKMMKQAIKLGKKKQTCKQEVVGCRKQSYAAYSK